MIHSLTVTGDGTAKTLAALMIASGKYTSDLSDSVRLNWLQAINETASSVARIGDINTSASYGFPIPGQYGSDTFPPVHQPGHMYSTTSTYIYIPNAAVVSFIWDA